MLAATDWMRIILRLGSIAAAGYGLAKTALKPDAFEKLAWYDRVIRALGALLFLALFVLGVFYWPQWSR